MDQANARFAKSGRATKALSEQDAEQEAMRAKTERLRALRLARDAEQATVTPAPKSKSPKGKSPKGKKPSGSLSQWLADQQNSGRRS